MRGDEMLKQNHPGTCIPGLTLAIPIILSILALDICGCKEEPKKGTYQERLIPVTVLKVENSRLTRKARLTGSVLPWKSEDLRFQVPGKVAELKILTPGATVKGELKDTTGKVLYSGDVIATLDTGPYTLALQAAEAEVEVAKTKLDATTQAKQVAIETIRAAQARVEATEAEIKEILPLNLKVASVQYDLAENEWRLTEEAFSKRDVTDSRRATAKANKLVAEAEKQKVMVLKELKGKELLSYKADLVKAQVESKLREAEEKISAAQLRQASAALEKARQDIEKCSLRAPFDGILTKIHVNPGVMVDQAVPIALLVMMDPVRVDVAVSFKKIRDFYFGDEVKAYPFREQSKPERGYVYYLHTTADPSTRTFLAIVALRNRQLDLDSLVTYKELQQYPLIKDFSGVVHKNPDGSGPLYVDIRCLQKDQQGEYVWKVVRNPRSRLSPESTIRKVRVRLGQEYVNVITWLFRELADASELNDEDVLLVNPAPELKEDQTIIQLRQDWLFHPGELVEVEYDRELSDGLYLPSEAILSTGRGEQESYYVFVVENTKKSEDGYEMGLTKKCSIIKQKVEDLWKIVDGINPGSKVVVHGCYLVNQRYEALGTSVKVKVLKEENLTDVIKGYNVISTPGTNK